MMESDVYKRIVDNLDRMSKGQKKIAQYLINQPETAPFLTASKLANHAGVAEATVIRFAVFLGYKGYSDMQRYFQKDLQKKWVSADVFQRTTDKLHEPKTVLKEILSDDVKNLTATLEMINEEQFQRAVQMIIEAERIYIIAFRSARSLGLFLEFYLDLLLQNTEIVRQADGVSEQLLDITPHDLVIGFCFSRYTRQTVEVMKYVKQRGARTITFTDHLMSPLVPYGDCNLIAATEINSFIDSFAAPLSIVSALITAVTRSEHVKVEKRLEQLESLWEKFDVFYD